MSAQVVERTRARIEKWRGKAQTETQRVRECIKKYKAGGASLSGEGLIKDIREKGLVQTFRERREAWRGRAGSSIGQKEYKKETALEASAGQLKIQKGRVAIEA